MTRMVKALNTMGWALVKAASKDGGEPQSFESFAAEMKNTKPSAPDSGTGALQWAKVPAKTGRFATPDVHIVRSSHGGEPIGVYHVYKHPESGFSTDFHAQRHGVGNTSFRSGSIEDAKTAASNHHQRVSARIAGGKKMTPPPSQRGG